MTYKTHADIPISLMRMQQKYTYDFNANEVQLEESSEIPSDISENDLVDMLTECMAIILLQNKDTKIIEALNVFNPEVGLPKVEQLRKRERKSKTKETKVVEKLIESDSEKSDNYLIRTNPYFYKLSKCNANP